MAEKVWQPIKVRHCDHVGCDVALEVSAVYPAENLPDQAPRIVGHRCSKAMDCLLNDKAACVWAGNNPSFDPFKEKDA
jgi:hypothetical protein